MQSHVKEGFDSSTDFEHLIRTYGNDVLRLAFLYLKDSQTAEDAFQDVFTKVYKKMNSFRGESETKTWVIRITINVCKDYLKTRWKKQVDTGDDAIKLAEMLETSNDKNQPEEQAIINERNERLFNAVMNLPLNFRDVILLYYYQDFDTVQISKTLVVGQSTVRSRLHRARKMLEDDLKETITF